jgi:WXG100 family type VII secretion target
MSTPLRLYPEDLRAAAGDLGRLSGDTDQVQQRLDRSWGRLDSGWEWYAEEDIAGYFQRAARELSLMAAMLAQMGQALVKTADLIEAADQASAALFEVSVATGGKGSPGLKSPALLGSLIAPVNIPARSEGEGGWDDFIEQLQNWLNGKGWKTNKEIAHDIHIQVGAQNPSLSPEFISSPTPTPTPTPTQPLQPDTPLPTPEERVPVVQQAIIAYHGDLPVEIVLAVASAETGPVFEWDNEGDGVMQVTDLSGHHEASGAYTNTPAGIEANIKDGVAVLDGYRAMINNETENNRYGDYGDMFDDFENAEVIRTLLHYNGGNYPITLYANGVGTPDYLGRIAYRLEQTVPGTFGSQYANPTLVEELRKAQALVDDAIAKKREELGISSDAGNRVTAR